MDQLVNMQALGEQLLLLRRRAGLSQSALAQRAGVDTMTISRIESGQKKRLELETAARLARVFGSSLDQLCGLQPAAGEALSMPSTPAPTEASPVLAVRRTPMDERQLAAQIYGWHNDEGLSLQAIVQRLNATGVPTRTGRGQWYQASVSEFLRQQIPQRKAARTEFLARYGSGPHTADEVPAPKPPAKRPQTRKAAPVG